jgi:hypothetical protein
MAGENEAPPGANGAPAPFAVFHTNEALNERLERAQKQKLKALGFESEEAAKAALDELKQRREAEAETAKKNQSELERVKGEKEAAENAKKAAEALAEESRLQAHMYKVCAEKGIKNVEYAMFEVSKKLEKLGPTEELDEVAFLDGLMKDATKKAALGVAEPAQQTQQVGANTTTNAGGQAEINAPPPPPGGAPAGAVKDVSKMTRDEFVAYSQKVHGYTPQ